MATNVTYASALTTILTYATDNGFDNEEVVAKINALIAQKSKTRANNGKTKARKMNEDIARDIVKAMHDNNVEVIDNKWVRDMFPILPDGKDNNAARTTAILNAGCEEGILQRHVTAKSATRNTLTFTAC